jgi:nitroreductase
MDTFEAIFKRRSVREFTGDAIPPTDLIRLIEAARWAPSGYNRQPWEFVLVTDVATIQQLKVAAPWMDKAAAVIAVVLDQACSQFWLEDGAAAIENILLAATAMGYGSCWLQGDSAPLEDKFKALLGVPAEKRLLTLIPIGVPVSWPTREKKPLDQILHWERYGQRAS